MLTPSGLQLYCTSYTVRLSIAATAELLVHFFNSLHQSINTGCTHIFV